MKSISMRRDGPEDAHLATPPEEHVDRLMDSVPWLAPAVAIGWSVVLLVVGVLGLLKIGVSPYTGTDATAKLVRIRVNPLLSTVNVAIGAVGLIVIWRPLFARRYLVWLSRISLALALYSMYVSTQPENNLVGSNGYTIAFYFIIAFTAIW